MTERSQIETFTDVLDTLQAAAQLVGDNLSWVRNAATLHFAIDVVCDNPDKRIKGLCYHILEKCHEEDQALFKTFDLAIEYVKLTLWFAGKREL